MAFGFLKKLFKKKETVTPSKLPSLPTPMTKESGGEASVENVKARMDFLMTQMESLKLQFDTINQKIDNLDRMISELYRMSKS